MRICIYGAGAVGGNFAARLAASGHYVSVVARGANLAALKKRGIELHSGDKVIKAKLRASDRPAELGPQDVVLSTLKANSLPALAEGVGPLLGPETAVLFAQNGIPWWYAQGLSKSRPKPPDLTRLDPGGKLARAVAPERVVGAIIFSGNELVKPGVVHHISTNINRLQIGTPDDRPSYRIEALRSALNEAGITSPPVADIRHAIWMKLLYIIAVSPLCLLAERGTAMLLEDKALLDTARTVMREGIATARAHGIDIPDDLGGQKIPSQTADHKPSLLQDYERGRPMEIDVTLTAPLEFARSAGVPTPALAAVTALAARRAADKGLCTL
jgi:2-dehydropantoate 2-reductase